MKKCIGVVLLGATFVISGCQEPRKPAETAEVSDIEKTALPSWNKGPAKGAIVDFVERTTTEGLDFVPVEDRIACFDNDGTLWSEQPMYFQLAFAIDRVKEMAPDHPEWNDTEPFKALLEGDIEKVMAGGEKSILALVAATHSGMSHDEFSDQVRAWIHTARHPKTGKLYKDMVYQPMLELLHYLRANGYKTFIVSGGGADFMRPWTEEVYGIPSYQVVGSSAKSAYEVVDGKGVMNKLPAIGFIDDKSGKPVGIHAHIGKRPVFAAGNSDGDYEMLQYTTSGEGPRFAMIVHHTDSLREVAYDHPSHIGQLERGLSDAAQNNWVIVDMEKDWNAVYPED